MATTKKSQLSSEKSIDFILTMPNVGKVMVAGSFNNWNFKETPLKKSSKDNTWRRSVTLKPGRYEYKFVVDGRWITDPKNSNRSWSTMGTENSVIEVR